MFFGYPFQNCSQTYDPSKNMALANGGYLHYTDIKKHGSGEWGHMHCTDMKKYCSGEWGHMHYALCRHEETLLW